MAPLFDQPAAIEDENPVRVSQRREPMGDGDRGASTNQNVERVLDALFRFRVDIAGRLVEDQNLGIVQQRAGDRKPLFLAAREARTFFAQLRFIAELRPTDEIMSAGRLGRGQPFFDRRFGPTVSEVIPDRAPKQERVLKHDSKVFAQCPDRQVAHIDVVNRDAAFLRVVEAAQQVDEGGLARATATDDPDHLARFDLE